MNHVLIFDVETTGLDRERDHVIELGYCLWSVRERCIVDCRSVVLYANQNEAEPFNRIPLSVLLDQNGRDMNFVWEDVANAARVADAVVAHQADFDQSFAIREIGDLADHGSIGIATDVIQTFVEKTWICTREDFDWPKFSSDKKLTSIALAHGVAVVSAHRSIHDVLLLARLLEVVEDVAERLDHALVRARRPKAWFVSVEPYSSKDLVKAHGFRWNGQVWSRYMAIADAEALPFYVAQAIQQPEENRVPAG